MYKILLLILSLNMFYISYSLPDIENKNFKLIMSSENMNEKKDEYMDINKATKVEMLSRGIGASYVTKILNYREITGGFENISELKKIKGIGEATYLKLSKKFKVEGEITKKPLYINEANDEILTYYGLSKNEIKKIRKFLEKNDKIIDNIELKKIIDKKSYDRLKDIVKY